MTAGGGWRSSGGGEAGVAAITRVQHTDPPSPALFRCPWCGLIAPAWSGRWLTCLVCGCSWELAREVRVFLEEFRHPVRAA